MEWLDKKATLTYGEGLLLLAGLVAFGFVMNKHENAQIVEAFTQGHLVGREDERRESAAQNGGAQPAQLPAAAQEQEIAPGMTYQPPGYFSGYGPQGLGGAYRRY